MRSRANPWFRPYRKQWECVALLQGESPRAFVRFLEAQRAAQAYAQAVAKAEQRARA